MCLQMRVSLVILLGLAYMGNAWDRDGHDAIGGTAMSLLDSSSSSKLKAILGGQDASDVAGWGHQVEDSLEWTSRLHFMPQMKEWDCGVPDRAASGVCPNGHCLEVAIRHFFRQLTRTEETKGLNVMETEVDFTDADALRFLINLVGDLSQPMHVGFHSDDYGKATFVRLPDGVVQTDERVVSVYDMWDSKLTQYLINNPRNPNFWWSGWTHVKNMHPVTLDNEKKLWAKKGIDAVSDWIRDSVDIACGKIYSDPFHSSKITLSASKDHPFQLSSEIVGLWEQQMRERILLGGARLGLMLTAILNSKDAPSGAKLRRGSAVNGVTDDETIDLSNAFEDFDQPARKRERPGAGYNAGLINIGILAVVVLVVLIFMRFGGPSSPAEFKKQAKTTLVEMVGASTKPGTNSHRD